MRAEGVAPDGLAAWAVRSLPAIYGLVALFVAGALCVLTPPFFVPDESAHARRAIAIAHGALFAEQRPEGVGAPVDANVLAVADTMDQLRDGIAARFPVASKRPDGRVNPSELEAVAPVRWAHKSVFTKFQNTAVYPPALYLPQALGWRLSEAGNLTVVHSLMLCRLLTAFCSIAIGWTALRVCGGGRLLLFAFLLLPTGLSLGASCSQDGLLLTLAGLTAALVWRAVEFGRGFSAGELVVTGGLLIVCIGSRVPYLPLASLLFVPVLEVQGWRWRQMGGPALAGLLVVVVVGAWQAAVRPLGTFAGPEAQPASQLAFLRTYPLRGSLNVLEGTANDLPGLAVKGLDTLGSSDVFPPRMVFGMLLAGMLGIAGLDRSIRLQSWAARAAVGFSLLAVAVAMSLAEYIIWTPPGVPRVDGLQSRYFLPLIPFSFLILPRLLIRDFGPGERRCKLRKAAMVLAGALFVLGVLDTPSVAARGFYGSGLRAALELVLR